MEQIAPPASRSSNLRDGRYRSGTGAFRGRDLSHLMDVDVAALEAELRAKTNAEIRFDDGSRALYATDASNYRQPPIGVVIPRSIDDVTNAVAACRRFQAPIVNRGGGTSLTGGAVNVAVVVDSSKYLNRILEINADAKWARVESGVILDTLRDQAVGFGLTFGPDPATHNRCTLGGMLGNNSCGMHAQMAGRVSDNVRELDVLTYDGLRLTVGRTSPEELESIIKMGGRRAQIYSDLKRLGDRYGPLIRERFPKIPRRVSGYNLDDLLPENGFDVARALVGTEGTCVTILGAKLRLVYAPRKRALYTIGFPSIADAADHVPVLLEFGPIGFEALDRKLIGYVRKEGSAKSRALSLLPEGSGFLLLEFEGETSEEADAKAERMKQYLRRHGVAEDRIRGYDDPADERELWEVRESGLGATAFVKGQPDNWPGWEDAGIPPEHLGDYLRDYRSLLDKHGLDCSIYGHFGQGCVHCRIDFDLKSAEGVATYRSFVEEAADLVVSYGGSLSGEHGDGQSRAELLPKMFGTDLMRAMAEFKRIWDPEWKMNPGKIVEPYKIDENLRLGPHYDPKPVQTHFHYPDDGHFAHATLRCVGVGKCRRLDGGTMCPSYMVTKDEEHTTRGRAHMLFEMLQGDIVKDGWRDKHVKESLALCLSCKGCKGDCPVQVDIATLRAEFLSHYYKGRLRPMAAYTMGFIYWWAQLGSLLPWLANFVSQTPGINTLAKAAGGLTPKRAVPPFAKETFRHWFLKRPIQNAGSPLVLLWVDTFNDHFHPEVAKAAVDVLEEAGFQVAIPAKKLCCGRPLYDYGFLDLAKRLLVKDLESLKDVIDRGVPIVGLEPSCMSVFRDELVNLMPEREVAHRLKSQCYMLGEFLSRKVTETFPNYAPPKLARRALVQAHCHHKAIFGFEGDKQVMERMGLDAKVMESGCCGLAGAFGYERGKYDISVKIAERKMAPEVRCADNNTLIIADGFSCHTQIQQTTGKRPIHLAQALQMALLAEGRLAARRRRSGWSEGNLAATIRPSRNQCAIAGVAAAALGLYFVTRRRGHIRLEAL